MNHAEYVRKALDLAKQSYNEGAFPAGALIVCNDEIIASSISAKYPEIIYHAESNTIDKAMEKLHRQMNDCILYASMEPCLMCLSRAYWAGIRTIYFGLKKENTSHMHYESNLLIDDLIKDFNEKMELIQIKEFENESLTLVNEWEKENL